MVNALGDVQPLAWGHASPLLRQLEHLQRRFVGPGLLGGDHVVKRNLEAARRGGEKIVVHVGNDRKLVARLSLPRAATVSGKGSQLASDSGSERTSDSVGLNPRRLPKPAHDRLQNFAIRMEFSLLGLRFEFRVETQEFGVGDGLAVGGENGTQRGEDSRLPVDEGAVAVKADEGGIEQSSSMYFPSQKRTQGLCPGLHS